MFLDSRLQKPAKGSLGWSFLAVLVGKKGRENQDAKDVVVSLNVPSDPYNSCSFGSSHGRMLSLPSGDVGCAVGPPKKRGNCREGSRGDGSGGRNGQEW